MKKRLLLSFAIQQLIDLIIYVSGSKFFNELVVHVGDKCLIFLGAGFTKNFAIKINVSCFKCVKLTCSETLIAFNIFRENFMRDICSRFSFPALPLNEEMGDFPTKSTLSN